MEAYCFQDKVEKKLNSIFASLMKKISYYLVRIVIHVVQHISFKILYIISDILRILLQHVLQYRKKTIWENLRRCYPEKDQESLHKIIKDTYSNLADILVEGIKGLSMQKEELEKRYPFKNKELLQKYLDKNQSIIAVNAHISNWEWAVLGYGYHFTTKSIGIYKTITNPYLNKYINELRALSSIQLVSTRETRLVADEIPKGKILILMADQNPSNLKDAIWVNFFNSDTACLHGIEKYAHQYNLPVVFANIKRIKRGYYELNFEMLIEKPQEQTFGTITQMYMSRCEQNIREQPGNWLWSHKRWKHKRSEENRELSC